MAKDINNGYEIDLKVFHIKGATPRNKGTFEDDSGKEVEYKEAVTIDLIRVDDVNVEGFGLVSKEIPLSIVIKCEDLKEAQLLFKHVMDMKAKNIPFSPSVIFPKKVTSTLGGLEFMATHK